MWQKSFEVKNKNGIWWFFPWKLGNMQPILFLHFCEKICTEKRKRSFQLPEVQEAKKKQKKKKNFYTYLVFNM
jgi:hypothetical protein